MMGKPAMEGANPTLNLAEEISTFCPVRLYLANRRYDGLLDTLDSKGGSFYVLTDEDLARAGSPQSLMLQKENLVELAIGSFGHELRIACKVRGMRIDEDGLFVYLGLDFVLGEDKDKRRLDEFIASLW
ncbi:MAG: PilZ domain-containing protein [Fibrobacteria bacterium]